MSAVATIQKNKTGLSAVTEAELMDVLRNSLYPGAQDASIKMVIGYCKAAGLDIMQKPVHIVPIWDSKLKGMRDVVMPGIGLYRTQASRSGECAGVSDPEFGEDVTETLGGVSVTYPKYCKVTIKRIMANGFMAEFTAKEFWKENYAVKGGADKSIAPNAMWFKRPYGQISKCAEAQALRKAFPELGSQATADEMEGKGAEFIDSETGEIVKPQAYEKPALEYCSEDNFAEKAVSWNALIESGKKTADQIISMVESKYLFTADQKEEIRSWEVVTVEGELV